ncbi:hypothetical protein GCM10029964_064870 [Kibdelosporangium lantanae]
MSTMPDRPHLDNFRRQARALQRAVRAGDPEAAARVARHAEASADLRLSTAQFVVAREYGYASWPRLVRYLETVAEHNWDTRLGATPTTDPAAEFCRLACLTYSREDGPERWARARQLLAEKPDLTRDDIWAAAAAGSPDVARLLAERPELVAERGGPFGWRPCSTSCTPASTPTPSRSPACCSTPAPTPTTATCSTHCRRRSPC